MANLLGVKRSTYASWESGIEPKGSHLEAISKILEVPISTLTGSAGPEVESNTLESRLSELLRDKETLRDAILLSLNAIQVSQADLRRYAMESDNRTLEILQGVANIERHLGIGSHEAQAIERRSASSGRSVAETGTGKGVNKYGKSGKGA